MSLHQRIMKSKVNCLESPNHSYSAGQPWTMYEYPGEKAENRSRTINTALNFGKLAVLTVLSVSLSFYVVFLR